jgi:RND family efflux transporter MFP subunit
VHVSAAVAGRVAAVEVREGQEVQAGQVVARLDDRELRLRRGEAAAEAEAAARRGRQLEAAADPRAAAVERARRDRLEAELALAEAALGEAVLRSPEPGVVLTPRVHERSGERLESGQVFCSLAALDPLEAEIAVPESDLPFVAAGLPAEVKLNAFPDRTFLGAVSAVRPSAEERDGRTVVVARVRLPNPDGALKPGMRGRGRIRAGSISLGHFLVRRPARWVRTWIWL